MELDVAVRTNGDVTVVDVAGEVDLYTAPRLEEALTKAAGRTPPLIVVNLGRTTYLDSTALRVLTAVFKRVRERRGEMAIAEVQPKIAKLFTLTGLDQVLPLYPTEREALAKVHPAAGT
ncbi:MAG TPA: STAS domain-containing protein [bacterium]|nr:STAS domain-containing protein [bacterium]